MKRNIGFVKKVMRRDIGLCRCCGFKASEVHHVTPLIFGGKDHPKNMVAICHSCHKYAPNTKQEFYEYMKSGGFKTQILLGKIVQFAQKLENSSKGEYTFMQGFVLGKKMFKSIRQFDINLCLEDYNLKDSFKVEDVDFTDGLGKNKGNNDKNKGILKGRSKQSVA